MTQYILNKAPSYSGAWHIWTGDNVLCGQLTLKHIVHNSLTTEIPSSVCKSCLAIARKAHYTKPVLNKRGEVLGYSVAVKKRLTDARKAWLWQNKLWLWQNSKPMNYGVGNEEKKHT